MPSALQDPFGLVGTRLEGQYRIDEVVGEGGYGVVYRGWHDSLEQPIAIKALKVLSAEDRRVQDALFAKFKDEAKLLYTLSQQSLHIVRSIDFGATTSPSGLWSPYMILEWLEGKSLAEDLAERRARRERGRSLDEALALLAPAAEGLGVAHQRRVAHRDVKPANFFLLSANDGPRVKVLDFGIAKIVRDGEGPGTRSPFSSFTWLYAAPEQLDPRVGGSGLETDVYSFALLFAELLTDRAPSEGRDVVQLLKAAVDPTIRPTPRQRGAVVPDAIEAVCRRALAVDPKARYATITELWTALEAARRPPPPRDISARVSNVPPTQPSAGEAVAAAMRSPLSAPMPGAVSGPMPGSVPVYTAPVMTPPVMSPPVHTPLVHTPPVLSPYPQHPPSAAAMSPPPMLPPPGTVHYGQRRMAPAPTSGSGNATVILTVIGVVLALLFAATCAGVHAACS